LGPPARGFYSSREQLWQIATAVDDALDANDLADDAKEDDVSSHDCEARVFADLRTKLIEQRLPTDAVDFSANLADKTHGAAGIVLGDEVADGLQIAFDPARKLYAHSFSFFPDLAID
jgi:hypothetical protein